jgi:hypothetical protein
VRIVAFNTAEGWSRDVTKDIADQLRRRFAEYDEVPASLQAFVETVSQAQLKVGQITVVGQFPDVRKYHPAVSASAAGFSCAKPDARTNLIAGDGDSRCR